MYCTRPSDSWSRLTHASTHIVAEYKGLSVCSDNCRVHLIVQHLARSSRNSHCRIDHAAATHCQSQLAALVLLERVWATDIAVSPTGWWSAALWLAACTRQAEPRACACRVSGPTARTSRNAFGGRLLRLEHGTYQGREALARNTRGRRRWRLWCDCRRRLYEQ